MLLLEQQITSLELSKRLCELGVKQESLFYWYILDKNHPLFEVHKKIKHKEDLQKLLDGGIYYKLDPYEKILGEFLQYSVFTVSELGDLLKCGLQSALIVDTATNKIKEFQVFSPYYNIYQLAETEVDARAKILIHLIENKLIEVKNL